MKVSYMLVAQGPTSHQPLNCAIFANGDSDAIAAAQPMIRPLYDAGYYMFNLWWVESSLSSDHQIVAEFKVTRPEPEVTMTKRNVL